MAQLNLAQLQQDLQQLAASAQQLAEVTGTQRPDDHTCRAIISSVLVQAQQHAYAAAQAARQQQGAAWPSMPGPVHQHQHQQHPGYPNIAYAAPATGAAAASMQPHVPLYPAAAAVQLHQAPQAVLGGMHAPARPAGGAMPAAQDALPSAQQQAVLPGTAFAPAWPGPCQHLHSGGAAWLAVASSGAELPPAQQADLQQPAHDAGQSGQQADQQPDGELGERHRLSRLLALPSDSGRAVRTCLADCLHLPNPQPPIPAQR